MEEGGERKGKKEEEKKQEKFSIKSASEKEVY